MGQMFCFKIKKARTVNHYLIQYFCNSLEMSTIFELWWSFLPGILSSSWNQSLKQENTLFIIMIWCKSSFWTKVNCIHMCNQSIIIYHNTCTLIQKGSVQFIRYWTFWISIFQVFAATRLLLFLLPYPIQYHEVQSTGTMDHTCNSLFH